MIELRWLRVPSISTKDDRLQFRFQQPVVDIAGNLCPGDWTEWAEVPVVIDDLTEDRANSQSGGGA